MSAEKANTDEYTVATTPRSPPSLTEMELEDGEGSDYSSTTQVEELHQEHGPPPPPNLVTTIHRSYSLPSVLKIRPPPSYDSALGYLEGRELRARAVSLSQRFSDTVHDMLRDRSAPALPYSCDDKSLSVLEERSCEATSAGSRSSRYDTASGGGSSNLE